MYRHTRLADESDEYLAAREELRRAEIDLMRHRERVAALRRALPAGPAVGTTCSWKARPTSARETTRCAR
ncbi:DUF899 family protein [Streptomyces griseosporeus]|uniref:DUF899 family protein n=1 Tax=Streptomyces griseosporeus TaxID=1910 RepID=UPI00368BA499